MYLYLRNISWDGYANSYGSSTYPPVTYPLSDIKALIAGLIKGNECLSRALDKAVVYTSEGDRSTSHKTNDYNKSRHVICKNSVAKKKT